MNEKLQTSEYRQLKSAQSKKLWESEEYRKKISKTVSKGQKESWENPERKQGKIIFGSKFLFKKRTTNKISSDEWKEKRLIPITSQGEAAQKGNRYFTLNIEKNQIIFKESRLKHHIIQLPKLRKNIKRELLLLECLSNEKKLPFQIKLSKKFIWISFDESIIYKNIISKNDSRILGLDLNPNYIGLSVLEFDKSNNFNTLYKEVVDLTELNKCENGKKEFELYQIVKRIISICNNYNCLKLSLEELKLNVKNHKKGKKFNKLVNNDWNRKLIQESLKKHCNIFKIEFIEMNAAYSSTVGNLLYGDETTPDMVAASIEIARRGFNKFSKGWFYPDFKLFIGKVNQWKEELFLRFDNWKEIHQEIKNLKLKYRVQLNETVYDAVFRNSSTKSNTLIYTYSID